MSVASETALCDLKVGIDVFQTASITTKALSPNIEVSFECTTKVLDGTVSVFFTSVAAAFSSTISSLIEKTRITNERAKAELLQQGRDFSLAEFEAHEKAVSGLTSVTAQKSRSVITTF